MSGLAAALDALDRRVHGRLADRPIAPGVVSLLRACSTLGDGWHWLLVAVALLTASRPLVGLAFATAMAAAANLSVMALKALVRRRRPGAYEGNAFLTVAIGGPPACDLYSFPSGHAANAMAVAVTLSHAFPAVTALAFSGAVLVGTSRVVLGHHYVSDTVAGVSVGLLAGAAVTSLRVFAL